MIRLMAWACVLLLLSSCSNQSQPKDPADLILFNGVIHCMDDARTVVEALAVRDGAIIARGTNDKIMALAGTHSQRIDLQGTFALPGFHDAHVHPISGGVELGLCEVSPARTIENLLAAIRSCAAKKPEGWLIGSGWDLSLFDNGNPSKELLDAIDTQRPIYLTAADGHSGWANSKALQLAGINASTPNPPNGVIERNQQGEATGTLRESAKDLVTQHAPRISLQDRKEGLQRALQMASALGITSMIEAAAGADDVQTYRNALAANALPVRISISLRYTPAEHAQVMSLVDAQSRGHARLSVDAVKIFLDGVLEGETAALLAPYARGGSGELNVPQPTLATTVTQLDAANLQVHMHAIGDRAARAGLDAVQTAQRANGQRDNRHHIAHLQLVHPDDYARFLALNVTANFQLLWAYPDGYITDINLPAVGQLRINRMYPAASIARASGRVVGGSDWSVSSMNPLDAIEVAVTRMDPLNPVADARQGVLNAAEKLSLDQALAAYTRNAAYLAHRESLTGSLEVGKRADVVVLARDLTAIPANEISEVPVHMTIFDGRIVYEKRPRAYKSNNGIEP